ncbi:hypothetical protein Ae201684P_008688 [Aphanomyces euteiches]|nr:hypothetical protein Ae201684P_008688 [Aphanomyces euteiches]
MATRWTDEDDLALLTQANNDRPFLLEKDIMKGWDSVAATLLRMSGFSSLNKESTHLSGVDQEYTEKHSLLDDLVALRNDSVAIKKTKQDSIAAEKSRSEEGARHIRDEAMKTCGKRKKSENDQEGATPTKKSFLLEYQREELVLERERLALKRE